MRVVVVNGTQKHGTTFRLKEIFLEPFRDRAEITEFYLPRDCPNFCVGCTRCFLQDEHACKDAQYVQRIEKAMLEADLLVFVSPAYVFHATGAMKNLLDHLGYRWMPHRPAREMFGKRAVIITQCLGAGAKRAANDIADSLSWWGVSSIKTCSLKLMGDISWDNLSQRRRDALTKHLQKTARSLLSINYDKPARVSAATKAKFLAVRQMQTGLGKADPEYADYKYWKANGWIDDVRPWR